MAQAAPDIVPIPSELRNIPSNVLEEYVQARLRQFSKSFSAQLAPEATPSVVENAYQAALLSLRNPDQRENRGADYRVRFSHRCRFLGCQRKDCPLCKNNPNKRCLENENFDECYADHQVLKSKCEADIFVDLFNPATGQPEDVLSMEIQVSIIDGESYNENGPQGGAHVKELLKSDEGHSLLGQMVSLGSKVDSDGRLCIKPTEGSGKLPDLFVTDKNDTFHMNGDSYASFRMLARLVKRDLFGTIVPVEGVPPAVSTKFVVKTQRALNDYRKSEYPHFKDELTKLKFIGSITAQRLREVQVHLGYDVPFTCIETVQQLRELMMYADQNRQVENKLLELLNMKGKHKHKWDFLRDVLSEKVVFDDMQPRAWFADGNMTQGLLFACKQAQVNLEKPIGVIQRVVQDGQVRLQVSNHLDLQQSETLAFWRQHAELNWTTVGHHGWIVVNEPLDIVNAAGVPVSDGWPSRAGGLGGLSVISTPMEAESMVRAQSQGISGRRASSSSVVDERPRRMSGHVSAASLRRPIPGPDSPSGSVHSDFAFAGSPVAGAGGNHPNNINNSSNNSLSLQQLASESYDQAMTAAVAAAAAAAAARGSGGGPGGSLVFGQQQATFSGLQTLFAQQQQQQQQQLAYGSGDGLGGGGGMMGHQHSLDSMSPPFFRINSAPNSVVRRSTDSRASGGRGMMTGMGGVPAHRLRRMSADPMGAAGAADGSMLDTFDGNDGGGSSYSYDGNADQASFKRSRDGFGDVTSAQGNPLSSAEFARLVLYHQESRGRHTPRGRLCDEALAPNATLGAANNVFCNPNNDPPALFGVPMQQQQQQHALQNQQQHLHQLQQQQQQLGFGFGGGGGGNVVPDATQKLSNNLQQQLHLRDASMQGMQGAGGGNGGLSQMQMGGLQGGGGSGGMGGGGSDGSGEPLALRMLRHSDSDSFKRLIESTMFQAGAGGFNTGPASSGNLESAALDAFMEQYRQNDQPAG